jgi:hypothetical protein
MIAPPPNPALRADPIADADCWPSIDHPQLCRFLNCWAKWRGSELLPHRRDINPVELRGGLAHVWLQRWTPETEDFVCVLAGDTVRDAWGGRNLTNLPLHQVAGPEQADLLRRRWRQMLELPAIAFSRAPVEPAHAVTKKVERIAVPLRGDDNRPQFVFGSSVYHFDMHTHRPEPPTAMDLTYFRCATLPSGLPFPALA